MAIWSKCPTHYDVHANRLVLLLFKSIVSHNQFPFPGKSVVTNTTNKQQKRDNKQSLNDSNYNNNLKQVHNGNNGNNENDNQKYDNNSKKFAFLAQQTIPDYRPQQINDKNQKTSTNQSTKFHQLQAIFGHQGANIKDIANLQNNLLNSRNSSLENLNLINSENEVSGNSKMTNFSKQILGEFFVAFEKLLPNALRFFRFRMKSCKILIETKRNEKVFIFDETLTYIPLIIRNDSK